MASCLQYKIEINGKEIPDTYSIASVLFTTLRSWQKEHERKEKALYGEVVFSRNTGGEFCQTWRIKKENIYPIVSKLREIGTQKADDVEKYLPTLIDGNEEIYLHGFVRNSNAKN